MKKETIAFIGTGVMGKSIVHHLLNAQYEVHIYTRTASKAESLIEKGAIWHSTAAEAVGTADLVFTMVGYPSDVEEVYFGDTGIFSNLSKGAVVVDLTTSQPVLAKKIAQYASENQFKALDAPVSGGDIGAQNGTLSIMVGGEKSVFDQLLPIFEVFGQNIVYQGAAGAGQHTKMCNQIAIATNMIGVAEALVYGKKAGLDLETVLKSIEAGAAGSWSLSNLGPRMMKGDQAPGFYIKHFLKDMRIALEEAELMGLHLPGLELSKKLYDELVNEGMAENGTQALIAYYK
ncbi:putative oxidoreductase YkwC [Kurthia zopfii]|uniref:2-hydroxy-3-oxopropionate reductase n=1 Tax=Kurthia zopfii TaxID=1650 RepID=A0A8B4Q539_9BACL|nr:NAD(P)-dependent oxidoreductase [Kurthia zopfii]PWI22005.1 oxidoreductase [Kurthia zopfii]TDR34941.1 3-hydroxyisobutyrate dehydrogenase [Kurthia zopfii]GEK31409.1 putative oxidoreductase YkwC [Kurthia zopfii]STX08917.1 2-hydroxy-3-oxopropionate reductase [Kurthia zopfii]